jgi:hypothetical protein
MIWAAARGGFYAAAFSSPQLAQRVDSIVISRCCSCMHWRYREWMLRGKCGTQRKLMDVKHFHRAERRVQRLHTYLWGAQARGPSVTCTRTQSKCRHRARPARPARRCASASCVWRMGEGRRARQASSALLRTLRGPSRHLAWKPLHAEMGGKSKLPHVKKKFTTDP